MNKLLFKLLLILVVMINSCESKESKYIFKGGVGFGVKEREMKLSVDASRIILNNYIDSSKLELFSHPEEIVIIYQDGYLFVQGDYKTNIKLEGYFVNSKGEVRYIDLSETITVSSYMKKINREGWTNPMDKEEFWKKQ